MHALASHDGVGSRAQQLTNAPVQVQEEFAMGVPSEVIAARAAEKVPGWPSVASCSFHKPTLCSMVD